MADEVVVRHPGEGEALWMLGGLYEVKAAADETGGSCSVMQMTIPQGMGPPPHAHDGGEIAYVIEGTGRFRVNGREVEAGPGSLFYFPAGTEETFEPTSTMRLLMIYAPGEMDRFFKEFGEPAQRRQVPPPPAGAPDLERLGTIAAKHGLEVRVTQQV